MKRAAANFPEGDLTTSPDFESGKASWLARMLFLSLACLIAMSIVSLINLYWLRQAGWWRNHTHLMIEQIDSVEKSVTLASAWYHMYQYTSDMGGLWRSEKELHNTQDQLRALRRLALDNVFQRERIDRLNQQITLWLRQKYVRADPSTPFFNASSILHAMRDHEEELLALRSTQMETWRAATFYMNCGLLLFSVISLVFLWRKWNQENHWMRALLNRLSEAEARFQAFMDYSPLLAFIKTRDSDLIYSNQPWNRLMGTRVDPDEGKIPAEELAERFHKHDRHVFETNAPQEFLEEVTSSDGTVRQFLILMFPFSIGNQSKLLGSLALDVTEAKRTQKALETSEQRLRLALQSGSMEVWEADLKTQEIHFRPGILGAPGEDVPRMVSFQEAQQFISPEFYKEVGEKFELALASRGTYQVTYRSIFGRWISSTGSVQCDESGQPVRVIGFVQDQTEKIEAERTLAELRRLHDSILRCAHVALISIDKDRVVTSWNPAAERLLGYSAEEVIGKVTPDQWHDPAEVRARAKELGLKGHLHSDPFLSEALLRGEYTQECTFTRKDGIRVPVRLTITPIYDSNGGLIGFLKHASDISELRRANHQIQELNQALQDTVSGWAKLDAQGRFVNVNKAYADTCGYEPNELIGVSWLSTVHPDDLPAASECHQRVLSEGRAEARVRGIRKNGPVFNEEVFLAKACDHLGNLVGCYCFMRDISARVEAEQNLAASERRYRELFEMNPLPCWIYDPRTLRFLAVNEAATRHYGYSQSEFLGMDVRTIRVPEEVGLVERELERFTKLGSWTSGPWHHRLRDGTRIEVELAARRLSENARLEVIRDITEQRQAELIRQSEAKLQEAQRIARLGSWELDTRSGAVSWSPETYRIFGLDDHKGKFLLDEFLAMVHPSDRDQVASAVTDSVRQNQRYDLQFRIVRRDGELRYIHGRGQFSNGSRQRLAGTMLDITDEKRTQEALEQSLRQKELLLKEIHHRVKNNLQVISSLLNMQAAVIEETSAVSALHESERRVMAMAGIHERLYGHERLDRIDFGEYAGALVQDLLVSYAAEGSQVEAEYALCPVDLHIEQAVPCGLILNELVTNVIKYAYPNGAAGMVFVHLQQLPGQKLRLSVADRGPGLPAGFDWKNSSSMGASIVRLLTRQLGGTLEIESSSAGASFSVIFPKMA